MLDTPCIQIGDTDGMHQENESNMNEKFDFFIDSIRFYVIATIAICVTTNRAQKRYNIAVSRYLLNAAIAILCLN